MKPPRLDSRGKDHLDRANRPDERVAVGPDRRPAGHREPDPARHDKTCPLITYEEER